MKSAIIKIMPPAGAKFAAVNYNAKKENNGMSRLVHFQNFGYLECQQTISKQEFEQYLRNWSARNEKIKNANLFFINNIFRKLNYLRLEGEGLKMSAISRP
jgi:hypothetical protein